MEFVLLAVRMHVSMFQGNIAALFFALHPTLNKTSITTTMIIIIIVSITKFSIVIGSLRAYLRYHVGVPLQVSNLNCLYLDTCNWIPT